MHKARGNTLSLKWIHFPLPLTCFSFQNSKSGKRIYMITVWIEGKIWHMIFLVIRQIYKSYNFTIFWITANGSLQSFPIPPLMTVLFSAFKAVGCHAAHREHMFKPSLFHSKGFKEISTSHELIDYCTGDLQFSRSPRTLLKLLLPMAWQARRWTIIRIVLTSIPPEVYPKYKKIMQSKHTDWKPCLWITA